MRLARYVLIAAAVGVTTLSCMESGPSEVKRPEPHALARVSGSDQAGAAGAALAGALVVRVEDEDGDPLPEIAVSWQVVEGAGTITPDAERTDREGSARATWTLGPGVGTNRVEAVVEGLTAVEFVAEAHAGPPAELTKLEGDGQAGGVGTQLDELVVRVADAHGNSVRQVSVAWAVTAGGGAVSSGTSLTDTAGRASVLWTLGTTAGLQTVDATVTGVPAARFQATAAPGSAAALVVARGDGQTGTVGQPLPDSVVVGALDAHGNAVPGVATTWQVIEGGGSLDAANVVTDAQGVAANRWTLGTPAARQRVRVVAAVGAGLDSLVLEAYGSAGPPAALEIAGGDHQTGTPGAALLDPLEVRVTDQYGNDVPQALVQWTVLEGGGTVSPDTSRSDSSGIATTAWTLGATPGSQSLRASSGALAVVFAAEASTDPCALPAGQLQLDTPVEGELTATDCHLGSWYHDPWILEVDSGTALTIELTSEDFDAFLILADLQGSVLAINDDAGVGTDSRIDYVFAPGTYVVWASSAHEDETGDYRLVAREGVDPCAGLQGPLQPNSVVQGELDAADCELDDGSYADRWQLDITETVTVVVDLMSGDFDAYLFMTDATGMVIGSDDDSGAGLDSRLEITLGPGSYVVWANSYWPGHVGAYTLAVRAGCPVEDTLEMNGTVQGELTPDDCPFGDGSYMDPYAFEVPSVTGVVFELASDDFDAFLIVTASDNSVVGYADDGGSGTDARLDVVLAPGSYVVWANSWPGQTGSYTLSASPSSGDPCAAPVGTVAVGQTVSGTLSGTDCIIDTWYHDPWLLELDSPSEIVIDLASVDFDAYILLSDQYGNLIGEADAGGPGTDARITRTLAAGAYVVWASSADDFDTGAYELTVLGDNGCPWVGSLQPDSVAIGALQTDDCDDGAGGWVDPWHLELGEAAFLRIDLTSSEFDALLVLTDADGNTLGFDDDGGDGTDASLEIDLAAGSYTLWVGSSTPGETGAYTVAATTLETDGINFRIAGMHLVQSTQPLEPSVPLVAGREALLRVFATVNRDTAYVPDLEVRFYRDGSVVHSERLTLDGSVPTVTEQGSLSASWNLVVDAALLDGGVSIEAAIDPDDDVAEYSESDNLYPAHGGPRPLDVAALPTFDVTLIPILQSANGRLGDLSAANAPLFTSSFETMFPVADFARAVRQTYTTTLPPLQPGDGNGSWGQLLQEIDLLRLAENATANYYGVVNVGYSAGIIGIGYIGRAASLGVDWLSHRESTFAHELGHNLSLLHAPCGGPGGPDPNYPYPDGRIGSWGFDARSGALVAPTTPDIMSYCEPAWIGPYHFGRALAFRQSAGQVAGAAPERVLIVSGRVVDGRVMLNPSFEAHARPLLPDGRGAYRLSGTGTDGAQAFAFDFTPVDVPDLPGVAHFAFALPVRQVGTLAELSVRGALDEARLAASPAADVEVSAQRTAPGLVRLRWDAEASPLLVVRDAATGLIVSFARGGDVVIGAHASTLELEVSNRTGSTPRTIVIE